MFSALEFVLHALDLDHIYLDCYAGEAAPDMPLNFIGVQVGTPAHIDVMHAREPIADVCVRSTVLPAQLHTAV